MILPILIWLLITALSVNYIVKFCKNFKNIVIIFHISNLIILFIIIIVTIISGYNGSLLNIPLSMIGYPIIVITYLSAIILLCKTYYTHIFKVRLFIIMLFMLIPCAFIMTYKYSPFLVDVGLKYRISSCGGIHLIELWAKKVLSDRVNLSTMNCNQQIPNENWPSILKCLAPQRIYYIDDYQLHGNYMRIDWGGGVFGGYGILIFSPQFNVTKLHLKTIEWSPGIYSWH